MRETIQLIIVFLISSVVHWALVSFGANYNIAVNFMFVVAAAVCALYNKWHGHTFAFFAGLFLDFFGVNLFGAYALTFTVCSGIMYLAKRSFALDSVPTQIVLIFILSIFSVLFYNFSGIMFLKGTAWHGFKSLFLGALINALIAPCVFMVFKTLNFRAMEE